MSEVHLQVQQTLNLIHRNPGAQGLEWNDVKQSLFNLDKAIANFGNAHEVTLIGDSIDNAHVFLLLTNALPDALEELNRNFGFSYGRTTDVVSNANQLTQREYCEVFEYFAFCCRSATVLIDRSVDTASPLQVPTVLTRHSLRKVSQEPRQRSSSPWYRANEARASLRQAVTDVAIWPPLPQTMRRFSPIESKSLLTSRYGVWTAGILVLQKLESKWQEAEYGSLPESERAVCDLRHALFWASYSKNILHNLRCSLPTVTDLNLAGTLQHVVTAVKFVLSTMKSVWLLDRLELTSAFGWFPRKIRDLTDMVLHTLAEDLEVFCSLAVGLPSLADIDRFGDFSFKIPIPLVERLSKGFVSGSDDVLVNTFSPNQQPDSRGVSPFSDITTAFSADSSKRIAVAPSLGVRNLESLPPTSCTSVSDMFCLPNEMEGLQVAHVESDPVLPESALPSNLSYGAISSTHEEYEMRNLECSDTARSRRGFQTGVLSLDPMPPNNQLGYIKSHISIFKSFSGPESYVRVHTKRDNAPTNDFKALLQLTELVPSYAFSEDEDLEKPLFLRSAGISLGLIFKIKCIDDMGEPHFEELHGLQGALIGARFEVQYSARSILLHRKGHSESERLRPIKLQIWTDAKELNGIPDETELARRNSAGPVSPRHREIPLDTSGSKMEETKIYLFSQHCIYVLFISDRIIATKQTSSKKMLSRSLPTTLFLTPNKSKGVNSIRVRVIEGSPRNPAGISLDQRNLHFPDQDSDAYTEFQSLQVEFATKQSK
jgi:hypothetical protein